MWHHLITTHDGATLLLYQDGRVVASDTGAVGTLAVFAQPVEIGRTEHGYHGQESHFAGLIDDVRIYNRALSADSVAELYALESGPRVSLLKAVKPAFDNLFVGTTYQLQVSSDLQSWTNSGDPFIATSTSFVLPQYWDVDNWNSLYFRLQTVP